MPTPTKLFGSGSTSGLPDCPDVRRETNPSAVGFTNQETAVTRDDVREVTRVIEGLNRRMNDVKREFEH